MHAFLSSAVVNFFEKLFQEYHLGVRLDPDQAGHFVRPDLILSGLIWVQSVCKGYQQRTLVDELMLFLSINQRCIPFYFSLHAR